MQILEAVNEARQTYGLRHDDYERYHAFCSTRLRRLRAATGTKQQQDKKFVRVSIAHDMVISSKLLSILLFTTERHWAYAMQIQQEMKVVDEVGSRRKHHHMIRKLKLAAKSAKYFYNTCKQLVSDTQTQDKELNDSMEVDEQDEKPIKLQLNSISLMEARAYATVMKGYYEFEKHDWSSGLETFLLARAGYEKLADLATSSHLEALCQAAIDAIDPNIRFCGYNLSKQTKGSRSAADVDALVEMYKSKQAGGNFVDSQMEALLSEVPRDQQNQQVTIRFRGNSITVKNIAVGRHISQISELVESAWNLLDHDPQSAIPLFGSILTLCLSTEKLVRADIEQDRIASQKIVTSKSGEISKQLETLYAYLSYCRLLASMQRNLAFLKHASDEERALFNPLESMSATSDVVDKCSELVGIFNSISQNLHELRDIAALSGDTSYQNEVSAKIAYYQACRCQTLATVYVAHNKHAEALALYKKGQEYASTARLEMHRVAFPTGTQKDTAPAIPGPSVKSDTITVLESQLRGRIVWAKAKHFLSQQNAASTQIVASPASLPLMYGFDIPEHPNHPGVPQLVATLPPTFAIVAKPMFFDLAYSTITMPNIANKVSHQRGQVVSDKNTKQMPTSQKTNKATDQQNKGTLGGWLGGLWSKS